MHNAGWTKALSLLLALVLVLATGALGAWAEADRDTDGGALTTEAPGEPGGTAGEEPPEGGGGDDAANPPGPDGETDAGLEADALGDELGAIAPVAGEINLFSASGDGSQLDPYTGKVVLADGNYALYSDYIEDEQGVKTYFAPTADLVFKSVLYDAATHVALEDASITLAGIATESTNLPILAKNNVGGKLYISSSGTASSLYLTGSFSGLARIATRELYVGSDVYVEADALAGGNPSIYINAMNGGIMDIDADAEVRAYGVTVLTIDSVAGGGFSQDPADVQVRGKLHIDGSNSSEALTIEGSLTVSGELTLVDASIGIFFKTNFMIDHALQTVELNVQGGGTVDISAQSYAVQFASPTYSLKVSGTDSLLRATSGDGIAIDAPGVVLVDQGGAIELTAGDRLSGSAAILGDSITVQNGGRLTERYLSPVETVDTVRDLFRPYVGNGIAPGANMADARNYAWAYQLGGADIPIPLDDEGFHIADTEDGLTLTGVRALHVAGEPVILRNDGMHILELPADLVAGTYGGNNPPPVTGSTDRTRRPPTSDSPPSAYEAAVTAPPAGEVAPEAPVLLPVEEAVKEPPKTGATGGSAPMAAALVLALSAVHLLRGRRRLKQGN